MAISIKGVKKKQTRLGSTRWSILKEEFVSLRASGAALSLEKFAEEKNVNHETLRKRAQKEKWMEAIDIRANQLVAATQKHAESVREGLRKRLVFDEVDVRTRLAQGGMMLDSLARARIGRLLNKVNGYTDKDGNYHAPEPDALDAISPSDAAFIMRVGQELQRKAFGLADKVVEVDINHTVSPAEERLRKHINNHDKVGAAIADMTRILDGEVLEKRTEPA